MSENKICPFCGEEIKSVAIKCKHCGEFLNKDNKSKDTKANLKSHKILLYVLLGLLFVVICFFIINKISTNASLDKVNLEKVEVYMTSSDTYKIGSSSQIEYALRDILKADENAKDFMEKTYNISLLFKGKQIREKFFDKYLLSLHDKHIPNFNKIFNYEDDYYNGFDKVFQRYENLRDGKDSYMDSLMLSPILAKDSSNYEYIEKVDIEKPSIPLIRIVYAGEGYFSAEPNFAYLYVVYSKHLGKKYKDYLILKVMEQKDRKNNAYIMDGALGASKNDLKNWIIAWYEFSKKYPDFRTDEINQMIITYTADLIWDTYATFDFSDNTLRPEAKLAYEELLKNIDRNSEPYQYVNKYYEILKKRDFKYHQEFNEKYHEDFDDLKNSYT